MRAAGYLAVDLSFGQWVPQDSSAEASPVFAPAADGPAASDAAALPAAALLPLPGAALFLRI